MAFVCVTGSRSNNMQSKTYSIGRHRGKFCLTFKDKAHKRRRISLGTSDPNLALQLAPRLFENMRKAEQEKTVADVWELFCEDRAGRPIIETMRYTWKTLEGRFGPLKPREVSVADCRAHVAARREPADDRPNGIHDGTIHTELGHLRMVLLWAEKRGYIDRAPYIERPPKPLPSERYLTRRDVSRLLKSDMPAHLQLFMTIAIGTGARSRAILDLTWDRCDFKRSLVDFRTPCKTSTEKKRAIVPMNSMVVKALLEARKCALSNHVIEWRGNRVQSVKKGLRAISERAGVGKLSAHMFRHSAAVHMAEAGVAMEEISQYLGHSNTRITRDVYARYSPQYLRKAASVLVYD